MVMHYWGLLVSVGCCVGTDDNGEMNVVKVLLGGVSVGDVKGDDVGFGVWGLCGYRCYLGRGPCRC